MNVLTSSTLTILLECTLYMYIHLNLCIMYMYICMVSYVPKHRLY